MRKEFFMSVRVNQRHLSDIEYENTFTKLNGYLSNKLKRIPKRHRYYLAEPFNKILNKCYKNIMLITNLYMSKKSKSIERYRLCKETIELFETIISYSYYYWNISCRNNEIKRIPIKKRVYWTNLINKEIRLIEGVMKKCNGYKEDEICGLFMKSYSIPEIRNVQFLSKLYDLQSIVYSRAIHVSKNYQDAQMEMLVELTRDAFYYAKQANDVMAVDAKTSKKRENCFQKAIDRIMSMNRPIMELAIAKIFSEKELSLICNLVTDCQNMLCAIKRKESINK
jgi:hypothetical protein